MHYSYICLVSPVRHGKSDRKGRGSEKGNITDEETINESWTEKVHQDLLTGAKKEVAGEPDLDEFVATYYDGAVENSFVSEGNSYRMNKVIEAGRPQLS